MRMREVEGNLILRIKNGSSRESHILEIVATCQKILHAGL
jgi:hypothetical protein